MKRVKIGDVIEIETKNGLRYAQYIYKHWQFGELLRVFDRVFSTRPDGFCDLVKSDSVFMCFLPLGVAVSRGIFVVVDHCELPVEARSFPLFRFGNYSSTRRKVDSWWLWDGENSWEVGELTAEQRKLSLLEILNDTLLIFRLESGWRPEIDSV